MDVDATAVVGTWFRQIPARGDLHYEPPDPADNGWQCGAVIEALYLADSQQTVWPKWYRFLAESGAERVSPATVRRTTCPLKAMLGEAYELGITRTNVGRVRVVVRDQRPRRTAEDPDARVGDRRARRARRA